MSKQTYRDCFCFHRRFKLAASEVLVEIKTLFDHYSEREFEMAEPLPDVTVNRSPADERCLTDIGKKVKDGSCDCWHRSKKDHRAEGKKGERGTRTGENNVISSAPYDNCIDTVKTSGNEEDSHDANKRKDVFRSSMLDSESRRDRWRDEERDTCRPFWRKKRMNPDGLQGFRGVAQLALTSFGQLK